MTCLATTVCLVAGLTAIDGDTLRNPQGPNVRLWGYNTLELRDPGGPEARDAMARLIAGQTLTCALPPSGQDTDRYGRYVRQCFLPDGRDIGMVMVCEGWGRDMPRYSRGFYRECRR